MSQFLPNYDNSNDDKQARAITIPCFSIQYLTRYNCVYVLFKPLSYQWQFLKPLKKVLVETSPSSMAASRFKYNT